MTAPTSYARVSRSGALRQCGNCRHWDDGECMAIAEILLPAWLTRRKEWMTAEEGTDCKAFVPGRFERAEPAADRGRRRRV
jgi:hypothetical protein